MKWSRTSKICFFIIWFVGAICFILMDVGNVSITYSGFGVDSSGVLYVGKEGVIEKYNGDKMVGTISPQTSRGYAFTVKEDDTILLSTASVVYKLDLSGKVLDKWEDEGTSTFDDLQYIRKFIAKDGRQYTMKLHFGRTIICSGEDVIYKMPMLDYIVRILWWSCFVVAFVFAIAFFIQWLKNHNNKSISTNECTIEKQSNKSISQNEHTIEKQGVMHIKFMFDYCACSCLWGMNGEGVLSLDRFPISNELKAKICDLSEEFDTILNWDDPAAGFVWSDEQIEDFRIRANAVYDEVIAALGEDYIVENWIDKSLGIKE